MDWTLSRTLFTYVGILFGGETVVLPIVLSHTSTLTDYAVLSGITAAATMTSDSFWYVMGRTVGYDRILSWRMFKKRREMFTWILAHVEKRIMLYVFLSKFVYGTRAAMQIAGGVTHASYLRALTGGVLGSLAWFFVLIALHRGLLLGFSFLPQSKMLLAIEILVFISVAALIHVALSKRLKEKYFT